MFGLILGAMLVTGQALFFIEPEIDGYTCEVCAALFLKMEELNEHRLQKHPRVKEDEPPAPLRQV